MYSGTPLKQDTSLKGEENGKTIMRALMIYTLYTGGQKFGMLTLILLSLKNR